MYIPDKNYLIDYGPFDVRHTPGGFTTKFLPYMVASRHDTAWCYCETQQEAEAACAAMNDRLALLLMVYDTPAWSDYS